jgi:hypothetical protein
MTVSLSLDLYSPSPSPCFSLSLPLPSSGSLHLSLTSISLYDNFLRGKNFVKKLELHIAKAPEPSSLSADQKNQPRIKAKIRNPIKIKEQKKSLTQ